MERAFQNVGLPVNGDVDLALMYEDTADQLESLDGSGKAAGATPHLGVDSSQVGSAQTLTRTRTSSDATL